MTPADLLGTWKLVRHGFVPADGQFKPTGENMNGQLIYAPNGKMSVLITKMPDPAGLSDVIAYSGRFSVAGDRVTHHLDVALQAKRIGTDEIRIAARDGDRLVLRTEPTAEGHYEITWQSR